MKYKNVLTSVLIREPQEDEFLKIAECSFDNFVSETALSTGESITALKKKIGGPPTNRGPNDIWFVIEHEGRRIGFAWIQLNKSKKTAFGYDIYLESEFRSKGFGRQVMKLCGKELKAIGINSVEICVFDHNGIARKLYDSLGFEVKKFDDKRGQFTLTLNLDYI